MQSTGANRLLVRLEHYFDVNDDPVFSTPTTFDLKMLAIGNRKITEVWPLMLGGDRPLPGFENERTPT